MFKWTGVVRKEKAPKKNIVIKNVFDAGIMKAEENIKISQHKWDKRADAVDKEDFNGPCWKWKDFDKKEVRITLKVGTRRIPLDDFGDNPDYKVDVNEAEVSSNLEMMATTVRGLSKGDGHPLSEAIYEAGKASKKPPSYEEGQTKSSTDSNGIKKTEKLAFRNDEWIWDKV